MWWSKLQNRWNWTVRIIGVAGVGGGIAVLMVLTIIDITARKLGMPIVGIYEWSKIVLAIVTFLGIAYTQLYGRHINIDLIIRKLSMRSRKLIRILVLFLSMVFFLIMTWKTAAATLYAYRLGITWLELQSAIPIWTVKAILPVGCALLSGELLFELIHNLIMLRNKG